MPELILIRGVPGSGKSTLAKKFKTHVHCENDQYFCSTGVYKFDWRKLGRAADWCLAKTKSNLLAGNNVVVSNTFVKRRELQPYYDFINECAEKGLIITVQEIVANGAYENIHDVPEKTILKMKRRWEV